MPDVKAQHDPELRKFIKKKSVAVIPVGSIEQHGPHLPVSTDTDIVSEVAKQVSRIGNFLLVPTVSFGVSFEHAPFFNLSIKESTLERILIELCKSLGENGIKTIFVINGHYGNKNALKTISRKVGRKPRVYVFSYWEFMDERFDHAGFVETSIMLAISNKVKMKLAKKGLVTDKMTKKQILKMKKLAQKSFPKATKNGVWGDPTKANSREGKRLLGQIVKNLQKRCQTCLTGKKPKLHQ